MEIVTITPNGNSCNLQNESYKAHTGDDLNYMESIELIKPNILGTLREIYPDLYFKNMHLRQR